MYFNVTRIHYICTQLVVQLVEEFIHFYQQVIKPCNKKETIIKKKHKGERERNGERER